MKFKHVSDEDVKVLRAAKKILKKLKNKENKLNDLVDKACENNSPNLEALNDKHDRMLDEYDKLGISVLGDEIELVVPKFPNPEVLI